MAILSRNKQRINLFVSAFWPYRRYLLALLPLMAFKTGLEALIAIMLVPLFNQVLDVQPATSTTGMPSRILAVVWTWLGAADNGLWPVLLLVAIAVVMILTSLSFIYLQYYVQTDFEKKKRDELFRKYLGVSWLYYLDQRAGDALNTITVEVTRGRQLFSNVIGLLDTALLVLFYTAAAAYISPGYILVAAAFFVLLGIILLPLFRKVRAYGSKIVRANQDLMQQLNEFVPGLKVVRASGMEEIVQKIVALQTLKLASIGLRMGFLKSLPKATLEPITLILVVGLVYLMRAYQVSSTSELAVTSLILLRILQRVAGLQNQWINISENLASFALITKLPGMLEKHRELRPGGSVERFDRLEFRHVSFSYRADQPALVDINLKINRGEFIGIVGGSGAGKTTLVDLVLSLLAPSTGDVLVNGHALKQITPSCWRDLIGYVPQETILFNDTIVNNITLLREGVTVEDVYRATRIAAADDFIRAFPERYETVVGDRGAKISGGQRQRLALARALAHKPQILLLDEATSSLDSLAEQKIQGAIEELRSELTIIVVAHRLSTVMNADRIIVLDKGRLVETGSPQDLVGKDGRFQEMYALQVAQV